MWFGKKKLINLAIALAMSVPAFAGAPVEPFQFSEVGSGHDAQQAEWDYLMKFKMFGTKGIEFHNESIRVTDSVGWFGTSKGSLKLSDNGKDTIGGPILVGKNVTFYLGPDVFTTGPMYVAGNVYVAASGFKDNASKFAGSVCVGGSADQAFVDKFGAETNRLFTNLNSSQTEINILAKVQMVRCSPTFISIINFLQRERVKLTLSQIITMVTTLVS